MTPSSPSPAPPAEAPSAAAPRRSACDGGGACHSVHPWPLHHVRHRNTLLRLCTSCVLRHLPDAFCFLCLDPVDLSSPSPAPALSRCPKCRAVAHVACLATSDASAALCLCPACSSPHRSFSYFPPDHRPRPAPRRHPLDLRSAKALLTASRLAAASINSAAAVARFECHRRLREAAAARIRARQAIHWSLTVSKKKEVKIGKKLRRKLAMAALTAEDEDAPAVKGRALTAEDGDVPAVKGRALTAEAEDAPAVKGRENGAEAEGDVDSWIHQLSFTLSPDAPAPSIVDAPPPGETTVRGLIRESILRMAADPLRDS